MKPVTWGIVSTAHINRLLIPGAQASPKVELIGVASRDRAKADAYAAEWGIGRAYGSYDDLLADPEIEAVYISLPNSLHCEWSIRALEAGKHVLCESRSRGMRPTWRLRSRRRSETGGSSPRRSCTATTHRPRA